MGRTGPRKAGIPGPKGRDFRQVSAEAMRLDAGTDGDVRRRKLNRPRTGAMKGSEMDRAVTEVAVQRVQERIFRAARRQAWRLEPYEGRSHVRF